jgi:hypothetical protein
MENELLTNSPTDPGNTEGSGNVNPDNSGETMNQGASNQADDSATDPLSIIGKLTGREFKSTEDFGNHYKELSKFVGANPAELKRKADLFDTIMNTSNEKPVKNEVKNSSSDNSELGEVKLKIQEFELTKKHPESEKFLDLIGSVAKSKGLSLNEAYESHVQDIVLSKLREDETKAKEKSPLIENKGRISQTKNNNISDLANRIKQSGKDEDKEALVREFFSE